MRSQQVFAAVTALFCSAAVLGVAAGPVCNSEKPEDRTTKCTAEQNPCEGSCGEEDICEDYFDFTTFTTVHADVRKIRQNEATHSRACVSGTATTICEWQLEDCYVNKACYLNKAANPDVCAEGADCEGPFVADYTSSTTCTPPGS